MRSMFEGKSVKTRQIGSLSTEDYSRKLVKSELLKCIIFDILYKVLYTFSTFINLFYSGKSFFYTQKFSQFISSQF